LTDDGAPSDDASPADAMMASETADLVGRAVGRLPDQQRAVVTLRVWESLSYARIAEIVECSEATVRSHMHHGLAALRKHLNLNWHSWSADAHSWRAAGFIPAGLTPAGINPAARS